MAALGEARDSARMPGCMPKIAPFRWEPLRSAFAQRLIYIAPPSGGQPRRAVAPMRWARVEHCFGLAPASAPGRAEGTRGRSPALSVGGFVSGSGPPPAKRSGGAAGARRAGRFPRNLFCGLACAVTSPSCPRAVRVTSRPEGFVTALRSRKPLRPSQLRGAARPRARPLPRPYPAVLRGAAKAPSRFPGPRRTPPGVPRPTARVVSEHFPPRGGGPARRGAESGGSPLEPAGSWLAPLAPPRDFEARGRRPPQRRGSRRGEPAGRGGAGPGAASHGAAPRRRRGGWVEARGSSSRSPAQHGGQGDSSVVGRGRRRAASPTARGAPGGCGRKPAVVGRPRGRGSAACPASACRGEAARAEVVSRRVRDGNGRGPELRILRDGRGAEPRALGRLSAAPG